jgi:hypothetical protein
MQYYDQLIIPQKIVLYRCRVKVMVCNVTYNNISVILWLSVLLVEETSVPGEIHWLATSHWQTWSPNIVSSTPRLKRDSNS